LTTKDQSEIFERTTETNHTQQPPPAPKDKESSSRAARSRFIFLEIASYKRCSRPLCSSQTTTPYHTPHTQPPKKGKPTMRSMQPGNQKHKSRELSNPRSCCLRTQQCAKH